MITTSYPPLDHERPSSAPAVAGKREARLTMIKAVAIALAIVTAAGVLLGLLGAALRTDAPVAAQPTNAAPAPAAPAPAAPAPGPGLPVPAEPAHRVVAGDTMAGIALRYKVAFEQIAADNGIADPNRITVGQRLLITAPAPGTEVIQSGGTLTGCAQRTGLTVSELMALNPHIVDRNHIIAGGLLRTASPRAS